MGKIVDEVGEPLLVTHCAKASPAGGKVRYSYYVSATLQKRRSTDGWRIPAREIEGVVASELADAFGDPLALIERWRLDLPPHSLDQIIGRMSVVAARLRARDCDLLRDLVAEVGVGRGSIEIECDRVALAHMLDLERLTGDEKLSRTIAARLTRSGLAMRLVHGETTTPAETHRALVRLVVQARDWWKELREGILNVSELAAREKLAPSYLTRVLRLAFLAPRVTEAVLAGKLREGAIVAKLLAVDTIAPLWAAQVEQLVCK